MNKLLSIILITMLALVGLATAATYTVQRDSNYLFLPDVGAYNKTYTFPWGLYVNGTNLVVQYNVTALNFLGALVPSGSLNMGGYDIYNANNINSTNAYITSSGWVKDLDVNGSLDLGSGDNAATYSPYLKLIAGNLADNYYAKMFMTGAPGSGLPLFYLNISLGATEYTVFTANTTNFDSALAFGAPTVNTGQGNNELYPMNQAIRTTDAVTFDNVTVSTKLTDGTATLSAGSLTGVVDVNATNFNGGGAGITGLSNQHTHNAANVTTGTFGAGDFVFQGLLTASEFNGALNWTQLQNYPATCPANSAITLLGDTVTCTDGLYTLAEMTNSHLHAVANLSDVTNLANTHTHDAANVSSGTLDFARLPTLTDTHTHAAANLTTVSALNNAITLDATNITAGTLDVARLPTLNNQHTHDAANVSSGTLDFARLPTLTNTHTLNAANITAGTYPTGNFVYQDNVTVECILFASGGSICSG